MLASSIQVNDITSIGELKSIKLDFNQKTISSFSKNNPNRVTEIMNKLSKGEKQTVIDLDEFIDLVDFETHNRLFNILAASYLPENPDDKLISKIELIFKDDLSTNDMSEGEKKKILLRLAINILSNDDSLLLLDEPDSYLHVANKYQIKDMINECNKLETILTTHSPTLTHIFDEQNIVMINNGKNEDKTKQEVFSHISNGIWNYQEQSVFLSSPHNIDLIVEGKFDKIHIETAIKSSNLGEDFPGLKFGIFDLNSCENMKKMFDGLCNADNLHIPDKKIIFIFDNEKQFISGQNLLGKEFQNSERIKDNLYRKKGIYLLLLPKKDDFTENFTIENMYPPEKFANCLQETLTRRLDDRDYFNKFIDSITDGIKDDAKRLLSEKCLSYEKSDFIHFRELFNLIIDVKNL